MEKQGARKAVAFFKRKHRQTPYDGIESFGVGKDEEGYYLVIFQRDGQKPDIGDLLAPSEFGPLRFRFHGAMNFEPARSISTRDLPAIEN